MTQHNKQLSIYNSYPLSWCFIGHLWNNIETETNKWREFKSKIFNQFNKLAGLEQQETACISLKNTDKPYENNNSYDFLNTLHLTIKDCQKLSNLRATMLSEQHGAIVDTLLFIVQPNSMKDMQKLWQNLKFKCNNDYQSNKHHITSFFTQNIFFEEATPSPSSAPLPSQASNFFDQLEHELQKIWWITVTHDFHKHDVHILIDLSKPNTLSFNFVVYTKPEGNDVVRYADFIDVLCENGVSSGLKCFAQLELCFNHALEWEATRFIDVCKTGGGNINMDFRLPNDVVSEEHLFYALMNMNRVGFIQIYHDYNEDETYVEKQSHRKVSERTPHFLFNLFDTSKVITDVIPIGQKQFTLNGRDYFVCDERTSNLIYNIYQHMLSNVVDNTCEMVTPHFLYQEKQNHNLFHQSQSTYFSLFSNQMMKLRPTHWSISAKHTSRTLINDDDYLFKIDNDSLFHNLAMWELSHYIKMPCFHFYYDVFSDFFNDFIPNHIKQFPNLQKVYHLPLLGRDKHQNPLWLSDTFINNMYKLSSRDYKILQKNFMLNGGAMSNDAYIRLANSSNMYDEFIIGSSIKPMLHILFSKHGIPFCEKNNNQIQAFNNVLKSTKNFSNISKIQKISGVVAESHMLYAIIMTLLNRWETDTFNEDDYPVALYQNIENLTRDDLLMIKSFMEALFAWQAWQDKTGHYMSFSLFDIPCKESNDSDSSMFTLEMKYNEFSINAQ